MILITEHENDNQSDWFFNKKIITQPIRYTNNSCEDSVSIFSQIKLGIPLKYYDYANGGN
jgi:hypothetical protein